MPTLASLFNDAPGPSNIYSFGLALAIAFVAGSKFSLLNKILLGTLIFVGGVALTLATPLVVNEFDDWRAAKWSLPTPPPKSNPAPQPIPVPTTPDQPPNFRNCESVTNNDTRKFSLTVTAPARFEDAVRGAFIQKFESKNITISNPSDCVPFHVSLVINITKLPDRSSGFKTGRAINVTVFSAQLIYNLGPDSQTNLGEKRTEDEYNDIIDMADYKIGEGINYAIDDALTKNNMNEFIYRHYQARF